MFHSPGGNEDLYTLLSFRTPGVFMVPFQAGPGIHQLLLGHLVKIPKCLFNNRSHFPGIIGSLVLVSSDIDLSMCVRGGLAVVVV